MTEQQAKEQALYLNEIIKGYITDINYKVFAYWSNALTKYWSTVLIPTKYNTQFETADYSQAIAFARVSNSTLLKPYADAAEFVVNFDSDASADDELNKYLNNK